MNSQEILKLLTLSFSRALHGKIWKLLFGGSVSSLIGYFAAYKTLADLQYVRLSLLIAGLVVLSIFVLRFILFFLTSLYEYFHKKYHESIYGDAIILLKDAFAQIHALRKKGDFNDVDFLEVVKFMCDSLKKIFDRKTKSTCSVSIKVPISASISGAASVRNLCRDSSHPHRDTDKYREINHTIIGNTPFSKVLHGIQSNNRDKFYYLNNNIDKTNDYENTSRLVYAEGILPYKSELVYPIIPLEQQRNYDLLGFLCVDCYNIDKFDNKYDVAIIEGVVDGLYDIMVARNSLRNNLNVDDETAA